MEYINAESILPKELIGEIQKYIEGQYLYIPTNGPKKAWGEKSGWKEALKNRNNEIKASFEDGYSISQLALSYHLSESSIRKIIK